MASIFVGNLDRLEPNPDRMAEELSRALSSEFGQTSSVDMPKPFTGYAFAHFHEQSSVQRALEKREFVFRDRPLTCEPRRGAER